MTTESTVASPGSRRRYPRHRAREEANSAARRRQATPSRVPVPVVDRRGARPPRRVPRPGPAAFDPGPGQRGRHRARRSVSPRSWGRSTRRAASSRSRPATSPNPTSRSRPTMRRQRPCSCNKIPSAAMQAVFGGQDQSARRHVQAARAAVAAQRRVERGRGPRDRRPRQGLHRRLIAPYRSGASTSSDVDCEFGRMAVVVDQVVRMMIWTRVSTGWRSPAGGSVISTIRLGEPVMPLILKPAPSRAMVA